jgi:NAD(P)-dependent dehydrogenase (short-subunit alcohol dehydrogenase family)
VKLYKTNVIGNIHLFTLFTPLVLKGTVKKVIHISSGHADPKWIVNLPITTSSGYALAKAATNIVTSKFAAQYGKGKDGVLFINICPGFTDTGALGSCMFHPFPFGLCMLEFMGWVSLMRLCSD